MNSRYGNPKKLNKMEREASDGIYQLDRILDASLRKRDFYPGVTIAPEHYYDTTTNSPGRLLIMSTRGVSLALLLERRKGGWTCYWKTSGRLTIAEGDLRARRVADLAKPLEDVLEQYVTVISQHKRW